MGVPDPWYSFWSIPGGHILLASDEEPQVIFRKSKNPVFWGASLCWGDKLPEVRGRNWASGKTPQPDPKG